MRILSKSQGLLKRFMGVIFHKNFTANVKICFKSPKFSSTFFLEFVKDSKYKDMKKMSFCLLHALFMVFDKICIFLVYHSTCALYSDLNFQILKRNLFLCGDVLGLNYAGPCINVWMYLVV